MANVQMIIFIEDDLNEKLTALAKRHRRSKRMEVMSAIDQYVRDHGFTVDPKPEKESA